MTMLFISMFIPSMGMYVVPASIEQNLELDEVSDLPMHTKEMQTKSLDMQKEFFDDNNDVAIIDAVMMNHSDIFRINEAMKPMEMQQEHDSTPRDSSTTLYFNIELFIVGIFYGIFLGFVCRRISMVFAIAETDLPSTNWLENQFIFKVICCLLFIFSLNFIYCIVYILYKLNFPYLY